MKICIKCILPETFPGIRFDGDGVCNFCANRDGEKAQRLDDDKRRYEKKFRELLTHVIVPDNPYDILMAYSGGKDSTYTMSLLKNKYGLRVLAVSLDNGFVSRTAVANIGKVTDALGIDHMFFKPQWRALRTIFSVAMTRELYAKKTIERASTVCTSCIGIVKSICLKMSIEMGIPMVGFGWSPGQAPVQSSIMKTNPSLMRLSQQAILKPLREIAGDAVEAYFLQERHYALPDKFPYNVHPMAWEFYEENMIIDEIRKLGWTPPDDTDTNSSNCLLNALANVEHIRRYGFHPYVWEIANMVRDGVMSRDEGFSKIYSEQPSHLVEHARDKIFGQSQEHP